MFTRFLITLKDYKKSYLRYDIVAGIMVAALTIPVAMGYAQIAGLPPIYGLYASILPLLGYAFFATSRHLIITPDSAASAITGSVVVSLGFALGSPDVLSIAPVLTFFAAAFLLLFAVLKAGRFASFISTPVISGFLSGLGLFVILGQIPKALGIEISGGTVFSQVGEILSSLPLVNVYSALLAGSTLLLVLLSKKFLPKIPMALIVLVVGTIMTFLFGLDGFGVTIVGEIPGGFPTLAIPDILNFPDLSMGILSGFVIAIVILSDSLLTAKSFALRNRTKIQENRELVAFSAANFLSAFSGASPVSASTSCTAVNEQYHGKTQMASIVAAGIIALLVTFFGSLLYYMPQPVLAGIIIAAVSGVVDVKRAKIWAAESRNEFWIWILSLAGVLFVGVIFGVLVGILLSFADVIRGITKPEEAYLGIIDGKRGFFNLKNHSNAHPLENIIIYRFGARLFFANISIFGAAIENAILQNPKAIIVDASGINDIDVTAAETLEFLIESAQKSGIGFYFAGIRADVESDLIDTGLEEFVKSGHTQKTIEDALTISQRNISAA
ncbi:SulP family inorganic anion transporter [Methanolapillus ohkumae]|uniref:Sulfate transporter n=1 Tax=Methanolapillus ohkumae TaxID=3028298 RepID=A0AA96V633_9EURY|nr:putative sulfate transporter [Methanosarcinaceae archaeon Am2]